MLDARKTRWLQLTAALTRIVEAQQTDKNDEAITADQAVMVLEDVFKSYEDHPRVLRWRENVLKDRDYQPVAIPRLPVVPVSQDQVDAMPTVSDTERFKNMGEARQQWEATREELNVAILRFENWEAERLYTTRDSETSEDVHKHLVRGQRLAAGLTAAEQAHSEAASIARSIRAVSTDRLSNHFPDPNTSELKC